MKTQKKSKSLVTFVIAAIVLLAVGFAIGVSDNTKLITASVVSGVSISDIQARLNQFSEAMAKNEVLLNDLESRDSENQNLETKISMLKQENEELKDAAFGLIAALNEQSIKPVETVSSTSSSHSSEETCGLKASDCPDYATFSAKSCACISIPPVRPNPAKNII